MAITDFLSLEELKKLAIPEEEYTRSNPLQFSYMPETIRSNPLQFAFEDATNPYSRRQTNALKLLRMPGTVFNEKLEGGDIGFFGDSTSGYDYDPSAGTKEDFNYLYGTRPAFERDVGGNIDVGGGITELDLSRFQGVSDLGRNDEDVQQVQYLPGAEPKTGIAKLLEVLGKIPTPFNLARRGIESLSRIPKSDFFRSKNLMDFLDMRRYGGAEARERARQKNLRETAAIQKQLDLRNAAGMYQDSESQRESFRTPASKPTRTSTPKRSSTYEDAKRAAFRS